MLKGLRFRLGIVKLRLFPPPYEPEVVATIERHVYPGATCADVGAHVGAITRVLAKAAGTDGRVVAFEAYPPNADDLRTTLATEGLGWITVENLAVTDGAEQTVWLHAGRPGLTAEWNMVGRSVEGHETAPELEVSATSLDHYFASGEPLHFVKIDVEGAEARVLAGMRRLLSEARPIVLTEFHDDDGWDGRRYLLEAGYRLETLDGQPIASHEARVYHCLAHPPAV
jgi:FkbM family methyltransferase